MKAITSIIFAGNEWDELLTSMPQTALSKENVVETEQHRELRLKRKRLRHQQRASRKRNRSHK